MNGNKCDQNGLHEKNCYGYMKKNSDMRKKMLQLHEKKR